MFITYDAFKSPAAAMFLGVGANGWSSCELALQQAWFLVQLQEFDSVDDLDHASEKTVMLFDFQNVEELLARGKKSRVRVGSVHIVTPGHINRAKGWQMHLLKAVWSGRELIGDDEVPVDVLETIDGKKYSDAFGYRAAGKVVGASLKFELSI